MEIMEVGRAGVVLFGVKRSKMVQVRGCLCAVIVKGRTYNVVIRREERLWGTPGIR